MPKNALDLMNELQESGGKILTFTRSEFEEVYSLPCETQRMLQIRLDAALEPFNLVVAFGTNAVIVAHDSNFAPHRPKKCGCGANKNAPAFATWECEVHGEVTQEPEGD